jgi:hypothetical protein
LWSLRVKEQVNRAAANADWAMHLAWSGQRRISEQKAPSLDEALALLRAVLKRFGPSDQSS